MPTLVECSEDLIAETLRYLKLGGQSNCETAVLWLGKNESLQVDEVYRPEQQVSLDYFRLLADAVRSLIKHLRITNQRIIAQVHSHPKAAFHSAADGDWAIVRHVGALSLVIPRFASDTDVGNFIMKVAVFQLDSMDVWQKVAFADVIRLGGPHERT